MKIKSILAALLISASLISCEADGDTAKPTITVNSPAEEAQVTAGDEIHFDVDFEDDTALGSFKVEIHINSDGHSHSSLSISKSTETEDFYFSSTSEDCTWSDDDMDIEGLKNAHKHLHIDVPSYATPSEYHMMVYCTDSSGNQSYVAVSFDII